MAGMAADGGTRLLIATCGGSDGLAFGAAPYARYVITILEEDGVARVVQAEGTRFPALEVWQYGGPNGSQLLLDHQSAGTYGIWDLWEMASLVPAGGMGK